MMTTTQLITSNDPKGRDAVAKFMACYNKMGFSSEGAQRLNESGEFWQGLKALMGKHSVSNQFASEEVRSNYTYPKEYRGLKPIGEQVDIIAKTFGLSLGYTSEWIEKVMPTISLPDGAEGWCAVPSVDAVAKQHFPEVTDPSEKYCRAVDMILELLGKSRRFYNYREGEMTPRQLRQHARTLHALDVIAETQKGDILIVPVQCGMRHRGRSVRRVREIYAHNEFGLGAFAVGIMLLTHPERLAHYDDLWIDCAGDEFAPDADGDFSESPVFRFDGDTLLFDTYDVSSASGCYGSVSGFLPQ